MSSITKRGRKKKKGYDPVIWSHRSAQKKEKHLKGAGNSRMFLFHQKTLFFSILFCAAHFGGNTHTHAMLPTEWYIYIYFSLSVLFTYSSLSYIVHHTKMLFLPHSGVRRSLFLRAQKRLVRNGQVWRLFQWKKEDGLARRTKRENEQILCCACICTTKQKRWFTFSGDNLLAP